MTTVEILKKARALIGEEGVWAQGTIALGAGRACAGIAIDRSCPRDAAGRMDLDARQPALAAFCKVIHRCGITAASDIASWNDAPGRTQAEVLAAFDRAIAITEQPAAAPKEQP